MGIIDTIIMALCALIVVICTAAIAFAPRFGFRGPTEELRRIAFTAGCVASAIGFIVTLCGTLTVVPTKNRGVVTTFGHVDYELSNGLHWTYPWQNVTNMDGTVQLERFDGATDDAHTGTAVLVTLGNNTKAHANSSIQWRLEPDWLGGLYQNFKSVEAIKENLVNTNFFQAMNTEMGSFDPLACKPANPTPENPTPKCEVPDQASFGEMSDRVERDVQAAMVKSNVGGKVQIDRVIITNVVYNTDTQNQLNNLLVEKAKTRVAEQQEVTNAAQAKANNALKESLSNDPNVLANKCFDLIKDGKLNSAVGCWPGSVGSGVPIIQIPGR
jgi:regulator of protease activity HflC (stomatin/prohibitin superfamily)